MSATTKVCPICKVEKSTDDYSIDKYRKDGLSARCRTCMATYWSAKRAAAKGDAPATPKAPKSTPKVAPDVESIATRDLGTDEAQAALATAADVAKRARMDAYNEQRRQARAAARLANQSV